MSFYYWKTTFHLDSIEQQAIHANAVQTLYTRYFDVDFKPEDSIPRAVTPIIFDSTGIMPEIIPVVYIKNRVLEKLDTKGVTALATKIFSLVHAINLSVHKNPVEIQFDCDWTDNTRQRYFLFLMHYKRLSKSIVSATIRLHQIKYAGKTGVPPVDYGTLMFYNMGDIDAGPSSSIYDKSIAARYITSIKAYPLILDIGLPIFAWSLQIRGGQVVKLLNKMNFLHFKNDSNFTAIDNNRYVVVHPCFHGGYYFKEGDVVKTEHTTVNDLLGIMTQVNKNSNHRIRNIVFYDLDKENLELYDQNTFRKIMDNTD